MFEKGILRGHVKPEPRLDRPSFRCNSNFPLNLSAYFNDANTVQTFAPQTDSYPLVVVFCCVIMKLSYRVNVNFYSQLVKLPQSARDMSIEVPGEGKEDGGSSLDIQERLLSKCALFVCNKWDTVPEKDVQPVKNEVIEKLKRVWPGVDPDSQIIYMSTTKANKAQSLGVISKEFSSLMEGLRSLVLQSIEAKLELHWE